MPPSTVTPMRGEQRIEPQGVGGKPPAHVVLPGKIGKRADAIFQRWAGDRPGAEFRIEPVGDVFRSDREAEPDAGKAEEFSERAQHDDAALPDIGAQRFLARADIHEGLVDDEHSAASAQRLGKGEQVGARRRCGRPGCWD